MFIALLLELRQVKLSRRITCKEPARTTRLTAALQATDVWSEIRESIGTAELHNVAVYVTTAENLYFPQIKRQANALLGYSVMAALGRLTFAKDGSLYPLTGARGTVPRLPT